MPVFSGEAMLLGRASVLWRNQLFHALKKVPSDRLYTPLLCLIHRANRTAGNAASPSSRRSSTYHLFMMSTGRELANRDTPILRTNASLGVDAQRYVV